MQHRDRNEEAMATDVLPGFAAKALATIESIVADPKAAGWEPIAAKGKAKKASYAGARLEMEPGGSEAFIARTDDGFTLVVCNSKHEKDYTKGKIAELDTRYLSGSTMLSIRSKASSDKKSINVHEMLAQPEVFDNLASTKEGMELLKEMAKPFAKLAALDGGDESSFTVEDYRREIEKMFPSGACVMYAAQGDVFLQVMGFLERAGSALASGSGIDAGSGVLANQAMEKASLESCSFGALDMNAKLEFLLESCENEGLLAHYKKGYGRSSGGLIFNDLDNGVALFGERLLIWSQNVEFIAGRNDSGGWDVHISGSYAPLEDAKALVKALDEKGAAATPGLAFSSDAEKMTHATRSWEECFELDLRYSCKAMSEEHGGEPATLCDIGSYAYQLCYCQKKWGRTIPDSAAFLMQVFATLGGGFDLDESGRMIYDAVKYDPKIQEQVELKDLPKLGELNAEQLCFGHPNQLEEILADGKGLTPDWHAALGEFVALMEDVERTTGFVKNATAHESYDAQKVLDVAKKALSLGPRLDAGNPAQAKPSGKKSK